MAEPDDEIEKNEGENSAPTEPRSLGECDESGFEPTLAPSDILPEPEPEPEPGSDPEPQPEVGPKPEQEPQQPPPAPEPPVFRAPPPPQPIRSKRRNWFRRLVGLVLFLIVIGPVLAVGVARFVPPLMTPLMAIRLAQGFGWDYRWRSIDDISPALVQAAVAAEDARFCSHHGFDFEAMKKAMAHNEKRPNRVRGGSTISQQTAKNVFLWPDRSYVRKGLEAWFTVLTEAFWGKRRIMEVYLNVVEWGPGIYGAEAASRRYFGVDAADLTPSEASRLTAILPSPLKWKAVNPGRYVARRSRKIVAASGTVRADGLAACVYR